MVTVGAGFINMMAITDDATSQEPGTERYEGIGRSNSAFYGTMSVRTISAPWNFFEHFGGDF